MKSRLIATAVISVAWTILDFIFHNLLLMDEYEATAQLWRPMEDMNMALMNITTIATALVFVLIYCQLIKEKSMNSAIKLGVLSGLLVGIGSSIGSYAYMPITAKIAVVWFIATMTHYVVAGAIVGKLVTKELK